MASPLEVPRDEVAAAVAARRELGVDLEPEIVDSLVDRIDRAIDARVAAHLTERGIDRRGDGSRALWLAVGSIAMGIPITAIAGALTGLPGVFVAWVGIAIVNVVYIAGAHRSR